LSVSKSLLLPGTGMVKDDKGKITCGTLCTNANATYPSGTTVVLTATPDLLMAFSGWSGACSGGGTCSVVMNANKSVTAAFSLLGLLSAEPATASESMDWTMQLDVPGAVAQVVLNGQAVRTGRGPSQATASVREGDNAISARLLEARGRPGLWRFEARDGQLLEPGSLRVAQGEIDLVTPTAVVFRLKGEPGEEVSFSYRLKR
jgi:hypothetical protein